MLSAGLAANRRHSSSFTGSSRGRRHIKYRSARLDKAVLFVAGPRLPALCMVKYLQLGLHYPVTDLKLKYCCDSLKSGMQERLYPNSRRPLKPLLK